MTEQDAIEFGKRVIDLGFKDDTHTFCKMAISALEKQISKKPYFKPWDWCDDGEDGSLACPNCKDHLTDYVPDDCQKILHELWSEIRLG